MDISLAKAQLRKQILASRPHSSIGLTQNLEKLVSGREIKRIGSYHPLSSEPDVSDFNAWAASSGIEVWFPKVSGEKLLWGRTGFQPGSYGITEPTESLAMPELDVVLVPALAVDRLGNRLGKGKGFYDRALEHFRGTSVGVVFDEELLEQIPVEQHDFKLNAVVTPSTTLFF